MTSLMPAAELSPLWKMPISAFTSGVRDRSPERARDAVLDEACTQHRRGRNCHMAETHRGSQRRRRERILGRSLVGGRRAIADGDDLGEVGKSAGWVFGSVTSERCVLRKTCDTALTYCSSVSLPEPGRRQRGGARASLSRVPRDAGRREERRRLQVPSRHRVRCPWWMCCPVLVYQSLRRSPPRPAPERPRGRRPNRYETRADSDH